VSVGMSLVFNAASRLERIASVYAGSNDPPNRLKLVARLVACRVGAFSPTSEASMHLVLRGMSPGEFIVLAFEEMQQDYHAPEFVKKYVRNGQKVELEEGGRKSVVLNVIMEDDE